jgi:hypothetical protein
MVASSGSIIPTETSSGDIIPPSVVQTPEITDDESDIDLSDLSRKSPPRVTESHPEREILVQFRSDIDGYVGQYQIDQIENTHDLTMTETISEQNIAVMEIDTPTTIDTVSSMSVVDTLAQTESIDPILEKAIDAKIAELQEDPRVEHVQRNFVYQIQGGTPGFSQLWGLHNQGQSVNGISGTPDADIDYPEAIAYAGGKIGT